MGAVYLATHLGTTRTVALKVIVPEFAAREEFIIRFQREAEAAGRLRHPNVVNVTDFGLTTLNGASLAYLVMEYLDGQTLAEYQSEHGRPPLALVLDIVDQVALALDTAHAAGIVHRDLKPDNVWLESNLRGGYNVKVLDFGIAKLADPLGSNVTASESVSVAGVAHTSPAAVANPDETPTVAIAIATAPATPEDTPTLAIAPTKAPTSAPHYTTSGTQLKTIAGSVLGTPAYMAPEQCRGEAVDFRADIYSLAIITYELVSGVRPFNANTVGELLTMQVAAAPVSPELNNAAIPKQVASAVLQGLEKDPAKRPTSAGTFAALLRAGAEGDFGVLRKSKDLFHTHPGYFYPAFLLSFSPLIILVPAIVFVAQRLHQAKAAPDVSILIAMYCAYACAIFLSFQCLKATAALLLREAIETGGYRPATWKIVRHLARGFPQILKTQAASLLDLRPSAFRSDLLWPVVWAMEGLSGRAAVERSRQLSLAIPVIFTNFIPRQFTPGLVALLLLPTMFGLIGESTLTELVRQLLSGGFFGRFAAAYPAICFIFYSQYAIVFSQLYWLAILCRGEAHLPDLPGSALGREKKRSANLAPTILAWWVMPLVMLGILIAAIVRTPHSALLDALSEGRSAAVLKAIDAGANVETADSIGMTPLLYAARNGDVPLVQSLLQRGARVNSRALSRSTPLILAALNNRIPVVLILLDHGAQINAKNEEGRTALCLSTLRGYEEMVGILMARGADPGIADVRGKTPSDYAKEDGNSKIIALLSSH